MDALETTMKRRIGRPPTGVVNPVVVASRVSPEIYEVLTLQIARY
jgi:hypothetical protein